MPAPASTCLSPVTGKPAAGVMSWEPHRGSSCRHGAQHPGLEACPLAGVPPGSGTILGLTRVASQGPGRTLRSQGASTTREQPLSGVNGVMP